MRRTCTMAIFAAVAAVCSFPALAAEITAQTHITAVTVYSDRATVTREAEIDIPAGASTAVIQNLPASLIPNSLRAEGVARAGVTLGALESTVVNGRELAVASERDLDSKLQALNDRLAVTRAEGQANDARIAFLQKLGQQAETVSNENFTHIDLKPEQWSAAGTTLYNSLDEAFKAGVENRATQRGINIEINALNAQMGQVQTGERSTTRVTIPMDSPEATTLTLKVSYQLSNATWRPVYDARLETKTGKLTLTQFGEVSQSTGEDWADVALTLSTAQPAEGAAPPHIFPQLVDLGNVREQAFSLAESKQDYNKVSNSAVAGMAAPRKMKDLDAATGGAAEPYLQSPQAPAPQQAQFRIAEFDTGGYVTEYRIPGPASAKSDSSANKVMIGALDATATLLDQVRPALSPHAFLMARVKIGGDSPLLPGNASLFRDGVFIGSETLPFIRPGEESTLAFGVDDLIVVKRQIVADVQGTSGILSKNATQERRVDTSFQNLHKAPVKLEVLETVPVARNDAIKLEMLTDDTTPGYDTNVHEVSGLDLWKMDLPASGKGDVKLGWKLTWPADAGVNGVNGMGVEVQGSMDRF